MANSTRFTCPKGGNWYACSSGSKFVGCCTSDPCTIGCVTGDVRPGAFPLEMHNTFPDAACGNPHDFYTCGFGASFWGCCKSNACTNTPAPSCPKGDLYSAFMNEPVQFSAYLPQQPSSSSTNKGAIIGGAVGGGVVALLIIVAIIFFCRRRKRSQKEQQNPEAAAAATPMMAENEKRNDRLSTQSVGQPAHTPPPTYSSPNPNAYQYTSLGKSYDNSHQQQYGYNGFEPQELPAESSSNQGNRYSELPAEASSSGANRLSELPVGSSHVQAAELESPQPSPRPLQTEFNSDLAKRVNEEPHSNTVETSKAATTSS